MSSHLGVAPLLQAECARRARNEVGDVELCLPGWVVVDAARVGVGGDEEREHRHRGLLVPVNFSNHVEDVTKFRPEIVSASTQRDGVTSGYSGPRHPNRRGCSARRPCWTTASGVRVGWNRSSYVNIFKKTHFTNKTTNRCRGVSPSILSLTSLIIKFHLMHDSSMR